MMENIRAKPEDLPFVITILEGGSTPAKSEDLPAELKPGDPCPVCLNGSLDYNGVLNLECSECGYTIGGCFT